MFDLKNQSIIASYIPNIILTKYKYLINLNCEIYIAEMNNHLTNPIFI